MSENEYATGGMIDKDGNWHPSMVHEFYPENELMIIPKNTSISPDALPFTPADVEIKHIDIFHHRYPSDEELRMMVRKLVAEALAEDQPVKEVPRG